MLQLRLGEKLIDQVDDVEDTKVGFGVSGLLGSLLMLLWVCQGNNGVRGTLLITNLRLIWTSSKSKRSNLCEQAHCSGACDLGPLTIGWQPSGLGHWSC
jgi:hypothetical protein